VAGIPLPLDALRMRLDGPHGAPSELVWKHRVVVLVGAGIGVTPFASILRSAQLRAENNRPQEIEKSEKPAASAWGRMLAKEKLENKETENNETNDLVTTTTTTACDEDSWQPCEVIYFYCLCRGQEEFEWFYDMLREAIGGPTKRKIVVNLFQTGEVDFAQVKPLGCGFGQFFGRPNWTRIFPKLAADHPEENIGVFLCGPAAIREQLQHGVRKAREACWKHGSSFVLHAENF